ncbi:hypothetical protein BHE90_015299 [Fusarium euwallaceae]|uniref:2-dehydropantoate 2-reductase n=1 Tax=Fusarium euwallaceae TaxID=1147111 RepID=A0A430L3K4_9HYPO|nr:hypothetical protein BHE90_015299 [Fusarium euwallaceae]
MVLGISPSPRVLVFGTGGIGAVCAFLLAKTLPAKNIIAVCRSNYLVAKKHGFTIESSRWGRCHVQPTVVRSVDEALLHKGNGFDYILVTTKSLPVASGEMHPIEPAVTSKTAVVLMQNGIGIEALFRARFPSNPILSTVAYTPVSQIAPTTFTHDKLDQLVLGTFPARAPLHHKQAVDNLCQLLTSGGAAARHDEDIQLERWKKLLINAAGNPICALACLPDASFFNTGQGAIPFFRDVMKEVAETARAVGYEAINDEVIESQLRILTSRPLPGFEPSMLADVKAGRPMEVDAIIGNVIKVAESKGIHTPRLSTLYFLARGLNQNL